MTLPFHSLWWLVTWVFKVVALYTVVLYFRTGGKEMASQAAKDIDGTPVQWLLGYAVIIAFLKMMDTQREQRGAEQDQYEREQRKANFKQPVPRRLDGGVDGGVRAMHDMPDEAEKRDRHAGRAKKSSSTLGSEHYHSAHKQAKRTVATRVTCEDCQGKFTTYHNSPLCPECRIRHDEKLDAGQRERQSGRRGFVMTGNNEVWGFRRLHPTRMMKPLTRWRIA